MVEQSHHLDNVFRALADPTRRAMLARLAQGEHTIGALATPFHMTLAGASKHIKVLEQAGLVRRSVQGRTHVCSLDPGPLASAHDWLAFYERFWTHSLDALDRLLREEDAQDARRAAAPAKAAAATPAPPTKPRKGKKT